MSFIKRIINYFKLKEIRKELEFYNDKYVSLVDYNWKKQGYSKEVGCYEKQIITNNQVCKVSFLKGIDLVLANHEKEKRIYLRFFSEDVKKLLKQYILLKGYPESNIDINMSSLLKK